MLWRHKQVPVALPVRNRGAVKYSKQNKEYQGVSEHFLGKSSGKDTLV